MTTTESPTDGEGPTAARDGSSKSSARRRRSRNQADRAASSEPEAATVETETVADRQTARWYGVGMLSLLGLGIGVVTGTPGPLLASGFGLAFAGYGALTSPPPVELAVERTIEDAAPEPGDSVRVTVRVTNESDRTMPDVRLIDRVPDRLGIAAGTPRHGAVLRPGDSTAFSYAVRAKRGEFRFDGLAVLARDVSGATERAGVVGEASTLTCAPHLPTDPPAFPLRAKTSQYTGRFPGDAGGPGVEFYATREYRHGDPLSRVDWNRMASTGELTTVKFRVERTVRVALVFDTRRSAHLAPSSNDPSAVERAAEGGAVAYAALTQAGHDVGIGALSPVDCWLPPGSGDQHRMEARTLLATHPALSPTPSGGDTNIYQATQRLKGRLTADAQVVVFSPLHDDLILDTVIRLDAHGYDATVVSPDPTATGTTGHTIARIERRLRIADLRSRGIPVVDWQPDEDVGHALARTQERWSR